LALKLDSLCEQLHQSGGLNIGVHLAETLLYHFSFSVFSHWPAVQRLFLRILYDVFHPQNPLAHCREVPNVLFDAGLDDELCGLVAIVLDEVIDNQLVRVEKVSI
jgi:hypothetical protein